MSDKKEGSSGGGDAVLSVLVSLSLLLPLLVLLSLSLSSVVGTSIGRRSHN